MKLKKYACKSCGKKTYNYYYRCGDCKSDFTIERIDVEKTSLPNINFENKPDEMEVLPFDPITPSHYHKNEIDVHGYLQKHFPKEGTYTVAEGFHIGNVIKYVSRYKDKNGIEDLKKAESNLKVLIELEQKRS